MSFRKIDSITTTIATTIAITTTGKATNLPREKNPEVYAETYSVDLTNGFCSATEKKGPALSAGPAITGFCVSLWFFSSDGFVMFTNHGHEARIVEDISGF